MPNPNNDMHVRSAAAGAAAGALLMFLATSAFPPQTIPPATASPVAPTSTSVATTIAAARTNAPSSTSLLLLTPASAVPAATVAEAGGDTTSPGDDAADSASAMAPTSSICWYPRLKPLIYIMVVMTAETSVERRAAQALLPGLVRTCAERPAVPMTMVDIGVHDVRDTQYWFDTFQSVGNVTLDFLFVEPQPALAERVRESVSTAGVPVRVVNAAIGPAAFDGKPLRFSGKGETARLVMKDGDAAVKNTRLVTVRSLDSLLRENTTAAAPAAEVPFLKIDCEGADAMILQSLGKLTQEGRVHTIVFEFNRNVRKFGVQYPEAVRTLRKDGYRVFIVGMVYRGDKTRMLLIETDETRLAKWPGTYMFTSSGVALSPRFVQVNSGADQALERLGGSLVSAAELHSYADFMAKESDACLDRVIALPCENCPAPLSVRKRRTTKAPRKKPASATAAVAVGELQADTDATTR